MPAQNPKSRPEIPADQFKEYKRNKEQIRRNRKNVKEGLQHRDIYEIEVLYRTDPQGRGPRYWYHQTRDRPGVCKSLKLEDVYAAAELGLWEEKRRVYWDAARAAWTKQSRDELLAEMSAQLRDMQEIRDGVFQAIRPRMDKDGNMSLPIKPRSFEGMVGAYLKLCEKMDDNREIVKRAIEPMIKDLTEKKKDDTPRFTSKEMQALAHSILKQRRKQRHLEMGIDDPRDADDWESDIPEYEDDDDQDSEPTQEPIEAESQVVH